MKKTILAFIALTTVAFNSNAQQKITDSREELQFGIKAGFNYSNVYDTKGDQFNADPKFGLATGAFLAIPIGKYFGIQPELLFSQKGFRASGSTLGNSYEFT